MTKEPHSLFLDVHGLRLHCLDWGGHGPPLLLLHGFMGHAHAWEAAARVFSSCYRVLALDQRGHGLSQWPETPSYDIEDHYLDIAGVVEALRLEDFILVGHSMGGRNALFYAAFAPNPVSRLVLVEARPGGNASASLALQRQMNTLPLQAGSMHEVARSIRSIYPRLSFSTALELARHGYCQSDTGNLIPRCDQRISRMLGDSAFRTRDLEPYLPGVSVPTLIVRGEESPFLSLADARRMVEIMDRAELCEIAEASHIPHLENPETFHRILENFLT